MKLLIIPAILLSSILIKSLIIQPNIAESLMFLGSLGLFGGLYLLISKKEKPINQEIKKEIEQMKSELMDMKSFLQQNKLTGQFRIK